MHLLPTVPRFVVNICPHHVELNTLLSQLNVSRSMQPAGLCHWQDGSIVGLIVWDQMWQWMLPLPTTSPPERLKTMATELHMTHCWLPSSGILETHHSQPAPKWRHLSCFFFCFFFIKAWVHLPRKQKWGVVKSFCSRSCNLSGYEMECKCELARWSIKWYKTLPHPLILTPSPCHTAWGGGEERRNLSALPALLVHMEKKKKKGKATALVYRWRGWSFGQFLSPGWLMRWGQARS